MSGKHKGIFYSILTISLVSLLSKIIGFVREGVVAVYFGTTADTDIFFLAYSFYYVLTIIIGGSIAITYLPIFVKKLENDGLSNALKQTSNIVNQLCIISLVLCVVIFIGAPYLSRLVISSYDPIYISVLAKYIRCLSLTLFFTIVNHILIAVLNGQKKYAIPQFTGMAYSLVTICIVPLSYSSWGINSLLYSVIISAVLQFAILFLLVFKNKKQYSFKCEFSNKNNLELYYLVIPVFLGTGTIYMSQFIDKIIAARLEAGSVSALYYSGVLHSVVNTLLIVSLVTVFYTEISQKYAKGDMKNVVKSWQQGMAVLILLLVPLTVILFTNSFEIIRTLLERGEFTERSTQLTSLAFSFYVLGSVFFGIRNLTTRLFYVIKDTKTPMINGCVTLVLNTILAYILSLYFSISGITLASVITSVITCAWLIYKLNKKIELRIRELLPTIFKVLTSSAIMLIAILFFKHMFIINNSLLSFLVSSALGATIYLVMLVLMKSTEAIQLFKLIISKIKR